MLLDNFKNTVDKYSASISSDDIFLVCKELGIDTSNGCLQHMVSEKLYGNIKEALRFNSSGDGISSVKLSKLQSELIYRYVLYDENPIEYLSILYTINNSCIHDVHYFTPFSETDRWEKTIICCKNYNKLFPSVVSISIDEIREKYPKEIDHATSAKELMKRGCGIEISNSKIKIINGLETVIDELNQKIKKIGGLVLAKYLFNKLNRCKKYSERFDRYFITREVSGAGFDQKPQIPFGFLLNVSLKYPYDNYDIKKGQKLLDDIIDLAIIIANGTYEVQNYSSFEFLFQDGETIIDFLTDIVLWDSIFSIPQCRPSSALDICDNLFSFIGDSIFKDVLGFTKEEFIAVSNELNNIVTDVHSPMIVYHSALCKVLKQINKDTILSILHLLAHKSAEVNAGYNHPDKYTEITFGFKPLIELGPTKFLLMNKSWCAPNYYEAIATPLRKFFEARKDNLDSILGYQLEIYLQNKLNAKGIKFETGDYDIDGEHGECDILIESEKAIILIESKKKVLRRTTKSGSSIDLIIDLSESVLHAQNQAGRTAIDLKENGYIVLKAKDGSHQRVDLNDRRIERVALTHLEFGGLHDKLIFNKFLTSLLNYSFGSHSDDKNIVENLEKLKVRQGEWIKQYERFCEIIPNYSKLPDCGRNCWFMSLPQLLEIINLSNDNNSFYELFSKLRNISYSTLDWYREFDAVLSNGDGELRPSWFLCDPLDMG